MPQLRLSVVLATFNRARSLGPAIDALLGQTAPADAYELVVVDNNSTDATANLLASITDSRVRAIREPRQGLSFARNTGLRAARASLVAFTDDDVEAAPDWVSAIIAAFDAHPEVDGVGGRVLPIWSRPPPAWLTRDHWPPLALQDHGDSPLTFDAARPLGLIGANLAFRRGTFARVGVFANHVQRVKDGVGSTEDHEMLTRLYMDGGRMLYVPGIVVHAPVQDERRARAYHRRWHYGHGRFSALMRNPDIERSRFSVFDVPAHLLRAAARNVLALVTSLCAGRWEAMFDAELRLRFAAGFVRQRLAGGTAPVVHPGRLVDGHAPDVSVIIPSYNHAAYLPHAIRSTRGSAHRVEVIVVDDGSTDDTSQVASRFEDVRVVRQDNRGAAAARNRGLAEARGRFIIFLDADDVLRPGAVDIGAGALEEHVDCAVAFGRCVMMAADGTVLPTPEQQRIETDHHAALLRRNVIWMPAMAMFRRDALECTGGFRPGFDAAADYDLYLRASRVFPVHDHGQIVAGYRAHDSNMSRQATRMLRETDAVMRQNRPRADARLIAAWRDGCRRWREFYGTHLVEDIRVHVREGHLLAAVRKAIILARYRPSIVVRELSRKARVQLAAATGLGRLAGASRPKS